MTITTERGGASRAWMCALMMLRSSR